MQARLPEILEYTQERKTHKTAAHYRAETAAEAGGAAALTGPAGVVLGDAPPPVQLDPEHATHVSAQRYQEICQRFEFARSYIGFGERETAEASGPSGQFQAEVERLRTKLEIEGIPLDSSEEDEDGSSSDDAPPSPSPPAAAGPSRRRR
ncbi:hypothetical protein JCGZ_19756 [Jatropha curcas]|uniref:Uncharacterized protein n=1 Tax=Jatropha curcas TaxID=180498 RepID=A0A067LJY9_JATCU|nr:hypothetical protein JCGZ_19756 [Jatropha curcas]